MVASKQIIYIFKNLFKAIIIMYRLRKAYIVQMAAILADDIFKCIYLNENDRIPSPIDNKPALVQVMAWHRTGDKPLPEPMLTQSTDAYMRQ